MSRKITPANIHQSLADAWAEIDKLKRLIDVDDTVAYDPHSGEEHFSAGFEQTVGEIDSHVLAFSHYDGDFLVDIIDGPSEGEENTRLRPIEDGIYICSASLKWFTTDGGDLDRQQSDSIDFRVSAIEIIGPAWPPASPLPGLGTFPLGNIGNAVADVAEASSCVGAKMHGGADWFSVGVYNHNGYIIDLVCSVSIVRVLQL